MKKIVLIVMSLVIILSLFSGCNNEPQYTTFSDLRKARNDESLINSDIVFIAKFIDKIEVEEHKFIDEYGTIRDNYINKFEISEILKGEYSSAVIEFYTLRDVEFEKDEDLLLTIYIYPEANSLDDENYMTSIMGDGATSYWLLDYDVFPLDWLDEWDEDWTGREEQKAEMTKYINSCMNSVQTRDKWLEKLENSPTFKPLFEYDWEPTLYEGISRDDFIREVKNIIANPEQTEKIGELHSGGYHIENGKVSSTFYD